MKRRFMLAGLIMMLASIGVLAAIKSDYDRGYNFANLKTWDFKVQNRMPRDPVGANSLWNRRIRAGLQQDLAANGFQEVTTGKPDFLVAYYMGTKERYDARYLNYGFPGFWGRWHRRGIWGPGWGEADVWKIPYTESTLVMDIIDPESNMLIWRGYDTETIDLDKSEKTIHKAIDNLVKRFVENIEKSEREQS